MALLIQSNHVEADENQNHQPGAVCVLIHSTDAQPHSTETLWTVAVFLILSSVLQTCTQASTLLCRAGSCVDTILQVLCILWLCLCVLLSHCVVCVCYVKYPGVSLSCDVTQVSAHSWEGQITTQMYICVCVCTNSLNILGTLDVLIDKLIINEQESHLTL